MLRERRAAPKASAFRQNHRKGRGSPIVVGGTEEAMPGDFCVGDVAVRLPFLAAVHMGQ